MVEAELNCAAYYVFGCNMIHGLSYDNKECICFAFKIIVSMSGRNLFTLTLRADYYILVCVLFYSFIAEGTIAVYYIAVRIMEDWTRYSPANSR